MTDHDSKSSETKPALKVVDSSELAKLTDGDLPTKPTGVAPDADDIESLWEDDGLADPLAVDQLHNVPVGPPRDFFMACPLRSHRRKTWVYTHKSENSVGKQFFIVEKKMLDKIPEARPCTLLVVVDRAGLPRIWPLMLPRPGESDNDAWASCRDIARQAFTRWVKLVWTGRAFIARVADEGYAPTPEWDRLPPFNDLIRAAFGPDGVIRNENNRAYKAMFGKVDRPYELDADDLDDEDEAGNDAEDAVR